MAAATRPRNGPSRRLSKRGPRRCSKRCGRWTGKAEIVTRFITADGKQAGSITAKTVTFHLKPATYTAMLQRGFPHRDELTIPPKAAELNLAISNLATARIGTVRIPLSEVK